MTAIQTPAADAPAAEWGALAVSIPGAPAAWHRTEEFILVTGDGQHIAPDGTWWSPVANRAGLLSLDVDHPATAGCLLALLGGEAFSLWASAHFDSRDIGIGRACISYAAANGRWPGGEG